MVVRHVARHGSRHVTQRFTPGLLRSLLVIACLVVIASLGTAGSVYAAGSSTLSAPLVRALDGTWVGTFAQDSAG